MMSRATVLLKPNDRMPSRPRRGGGRFQREDRKRVAPTTPKKSARAEAPVKPTPGLPARSRRRGQMIHDTRSPHAPPPRVPPSAVHAASAGDGEDELHSSIVRVARMLWAVQEDRVRVSNQRWALEDDGYGPEWTGPLDLAVAALKSVEKKHGRALVALVKGHPLAPWIADVDGVALGGLGRLLGCTGSLDNFPNVDKLRAFLGYHVVNGRAPTRVKGQLANWSRQGRVVCRQLADSIVRLHHGVYYDLYVKRRAAVLGRPWLGPSGCPFRQVHTGFERRMDRSTGWKRKTGVSKLVPCITPCPGKGPDHEDCDPGAEHSGHVDADAKRVAIKMFLKDLWVAWRAVKAAAGQVSPGSPMLPSSEAT